MNLNKQHLHVISPISNHLSHIALSVVTPYFQVSYYSELTDNAIFCTEVLRNYQMPKVET